MKLCFPLLLFLGAAYADPPEKVWAVRVKGPGKDKLKKVPAAALKEGKFITLDDYLEDLETAFGISVSEYIIDQDNFCITKDAVEFLQNGEAYCTSAKPTTISCTNIAIASGGCCKEECWPREDYGNPASSAAAGSGDCNLAVASGSCAFSSAGGGSYNVARAIGDFAAASAGDAFPNRNNNIAVAEGYYTEALALQGSNNEVYARAAFNPTDSSSKALVSENDNYAEANGLETEITIFGDGSKAFALFGENNIAKVFGNNACAYAGGPDASNLASNNEATANGDDTIATATDASGCVASATTTTPSLTACCGQCPFDCPSTT